MTLVLAEEAREMFRQECREETQITSTNPVTNTLIYSENVQWGENSCRVVPCHKHKLFAVYTRVGNLHAIADAEHLAEAVLSCPIIPRRQEFVPSSTKMSLTDLNAFLSGDL